MTSGAATPPVPPRARFVLVEAPVGYGKTLLAERLLEHWDGVSVRLPVPRPEPAVPAVVALAAALGRALRRCGLPGLADQVLAAAPDEAFDRFVGSLAAGAAALDLLLDDVHLLDEPVAGVVAAALRDLPAGSRAVVCGRDLTGFAVLATAPHAHRWGPDDLRLDAADVAELLAVRGFGPGGSLAAEIVAATDGWPAAAALAIDRLQRDPAWRIGGPGGSRGLVHDLVVDLLRSDDRAAALATLPMFDEDLVALVGRSPRPPNLPVRRVGRWWVVPEVVRDVVRDVGGARALTPRAAAAVARHYRQCGEVSAALGLMRGEDAGFAGFVADLHWTELAALGVPELRGHVDDALRAPDATPPLRARVLVLAARAVELSDRPLRAEWLTRAHNEAPADTPEEREVEAELARDVLRGADVDAGAARASALLDRTPHDEPVTRARALVTVAMREAFLATDESFAVAARLFAEAADLYRRAGETALRAETLARLGYTALFLAGRPAEGADAMAEALALLPVGDRVRAHWLTLYADLLDFLGRDDDADAAVREAIEIGTRQHDSMTLGMAWWTRSWLVWHRGTPADLRAALAQVEAHRGDWLREGQEAEFLGSSAERLTMAGDVAGYRDYVERTQRLADELDYPQIVLIPRAYFEAEHGDPSRALELLDELEGGPTTVRSEAPRRLLLRALAQYRVGDIDGARQTAVAASAAAERMGVPDLLVRHQRRQLDALDGVLDGGERHHASGATRLRVLGRFELTVDDADRTPPPGHAATLVKLLALGGTLGAEEAIDLLWPETDAATGRSRLRNTLNRLKERSGSVVVRAGDLLRLDESVRVDAIGFERAATAAIGAGAGERVGRARHALALYTGDLFAGDVYEDWAVDDRDRLRRRFVSLADLVADDCVARGDFDEAARLLDLGLGVDPFDERRTLTLCEVLTRQGRTGAARQVAARGVAALADIGVDAPPALLRLTRPGRG